MGKTKAEQKTAQEWQCPVAECGHKHKKPHYAFEGQINFKKKPNEEGRVKFDREDDCAHSKMDTEVKYGPETTGPMFDDKGYPQPLFCPHCGWVQKVIIIVKTK